MGPIDGVTVPGELTDTQRESLVAEVKGSKRSIGEYKDQLKTYMRNKYFDTGYGIVPGYRDANPPYRGMITLDEQGFQVISDSNAGRGWVTDEEKAWFVQRMDRVACQALLCNLDFKTLRGVVTESVDEPIRDPHDLVQQAWTLPPPEILENVVPTLQE